MASCSGVSRNGEDCVCMDPVGKAILFAKIIRKMRTANVGKKPVSYSFLSLKKRQVLPAPGLFKLYKNV